MCEGMCGFQIGAKELELFGSGAGGLFPLSSLSHDPGSGLAEVLARGFLFLWLLLGAGGF